MQSHYPLGFNVRIMDKRILLGVNIDHSATLRQARYRDYGRDFGENVEPDPLEIALAAERGGADGITVHLREDRRHIQDSDVRRIRAAMSTRMNFEMACTDVMVAFALEIKPNSVCLVPENRSEVTTEGGLDVFSQINRIASIVKKFNEAGIKTSLFIDPERKQIEAAATIAAPWIELHTGAYANAYFLPEQRTLEYARLVEAAKLGHSLGLTINAGHGINYVNIAEVREIPHLHELNIGHTIMSRALLIGTEAAVALMKTKMLGR